MNEQQLPVRAERVSSELERGRAALIAATRALNSAAALSELNVAGLSAATRTIIAVTEQLGAQSRERLYRSPQFNTDVCQPGTTVSVSAYNPVAVPLEVTLGGDGSAAATLIGSALHEGPPSSVLHGGTSAWLMDTVLGLGVQSLGVRAMTGRLEVRYLHRTPLDVPLQLGAELVSREGRKITMSGWIEHDGLRCVEAIGVFIVVGQR